MRAVRLGHLSWQAACGRVFLYCGVLAAPEPQDALAFQLALPKLEAVHAQVLGVSVDWPGANQAWAWGMGLTYPLLSDLSRAVPQAYGVLYADPAMAANPKQQFPCICGRKGPGLSSIPLG